MLKNPYILKYLILDKGSGYRRMLYAIEFETNDNFLKKPTLLTLFLGVNQINYT